MIDLLRHPRLPALAKFGAAAAIAAFTYSAYAQYRQMTPQQLPALDLPAVVVELIDEQPEVVAELPDFESYGDTETRKEAFFQFLVTYVESRNQEILATRARLNSMWEVLRRNHPLTEIERNELYGIAVEYRLDKAELSQLKMVEELLMRVDVIPTSLVLAQAANESAWGMSRFAREGNNIFGQWCFDEGCGLVPERRRRDASHEVRAFVSIDASIRAYFLNLNTNQYYQDMREMRAQMRAQGRPLDSMALARGLTRYSERGMAYVSELQDIIRINRLHALDQS
jgi:Bax protein